MTGVTVILQPCYGLQAKCKEKAVKMCVLTFLDLNQERSAGIGPACPFSASPAAFCSSGSALSLDWGACLCELGCWLSSPLPSEVRWCSSLVYSTSLVLRGWRCRKGHMFDHQLLELLLRCCPATCSWKYEQSASLGRHQADLPQRLPCRIQSTLHNLCYKIKHARLTGSLPGTRIFSMSTGAGV